MSAAPSQAPVDREAEAAAAAAARVAARAAAARAAAAARLVPVAVAALEAEAAAPSPPPRAAAGRASAATAVLEPNFPVGSPATPGSRGGGGGGAAGFGGAGAAGSIGTGALVTGVTAPTAQVSIVSSILSDSTTPAAAATNDCRGALTTATSLIEDPTACTLSAATLSGDPQLGALADNGGPTQTMAIAPTSPALDAGSNPDGLAFDQRGSPFAREVPSGQSDIGAFELQRHQVTVVKQLVPATDPGRFDLAVAATTVAADAGNGQSGSTPVLDGATPTVSEAASSGTTLGDYDSAISCTNGQTATGTEPDADRSDRRRDVHDHQHAPDRATAGGQEPGPGR